MKTLDEVIKAFEYTYENDPIAWTYGVDALHYLKALKDILDPLKVKKISHEITCPQCNSVIAILLPESKEPLTWDELKAMEGKPVWVENKRFGNHWYLNRGIKDESCMYFVGHYGENVLLYNDDLGSIWQAYRKERS